MRLVSFGFAFLIPAAALAEPADGLWLTAEAPAALVMSDAQDGVFRPGFMPALGAYVDLSKISLGVRLRAGVLGNGHAPEDNLADPGVGGLFTATGAARITQRRAWFELAGGAGMTGGDFVPTVEAGIGYAIPYRNVQIGPSIRYVRVISRDEMDTFGTAELALVGIDVKLQSERVRRAPRSEPAIQPAPVEVVEPSGIPQDDHRIVEALASCADDMDGCPLTTGVTVKTDRIILDEQVFFDFNRARVRTAGRAALAEVAKLWAEHPEWTALVVEGHADMRGSDDYNQELSQLRADRVRDILIEHGCAPAHLTTIGYGRSRPRVDASSESQHQKNRRVELVIQRSVIDDANDATAVAGGAR